MPTLRSAQPVAQRQLDLNGNFVMAKRSFVMAKRS
jgi:hypothetical protein